MGNLHVSFQIVNIQVIWTTVTLYKFFHVPS